MENDIKQIYEDQREILGIYWNDSEASQIEVGKFKFTKIKAYAENVAHCYLSFLAIFKGDEIVSRVPAAQVQIVYKDIV